MNCYIEGIAVPTEFNHQCTYSRVPHHLIGVSASQGTVVRLVSFQTQNHTFSCSLPLVLSEVGCLTLGLDWYSYYRESFVAYERIPSPPREFSLYFAIMSLRNRHLLPAPWALYEDPSSESEILTDYPLHSYSTNNYNPEDCRLITIAPPQASDCRNRDDTSHSNWGSTLTTPDHDINITSSSFDAIFDLSIDSNIRSGRKNRRPKRGAAKSKRRVSAGLGKKGG